MTINRPMPVCLLDRGLVFPPSDLAREDGLLAFGGDLSLPRLLLAYRQGIFPWYNPGDPILWWCPDPRLVLEPQALHVSRRLQRGLRQRRFLVTMDQAFDEVIHTCAEVRVFRQEGTWLTPEMIDAYCLLHREGLAHSTEAWKDGELVGGMYGVALGRAFFGESMFHLCPEASKVALVTLVRQLVLWDFDLFDCQVTTPHLLRFGAREIPRDRFLERLSEAVNQPSGAPDGKWDLLPLPSSQPLTRPDTGLPETSNTRSVSDQGVRPQMVAPGPGSLEEGPQGMEGSTGP